ncbi:MAG: translation elongation factor 4 [candidate division KSB1 bacterium]|nr:translation elongation factor 4 [candidate division KSB1 bacterium]MDZ7275667.1 translation elongation factor 4 [candidate division KSB1 bacterium]MDZ7284642.1 translation elongation factor 4 [candidate division KSB1 bacterium]MDZ7297939.1 translation elongation factor 4 [candidate division KSB1 bacterium]MDZ7348804.1 translation elongation factor 4 [candidate division KSB1 bacterium]
MQANIRNFCIIAHIDHGKSTLADRFLELTGALRKEEIVSQTLDSMDLERERGITIKLHAVTMNYHAPDGRAYVLNLIDTPGHVDFSYEVSRSLAACEGAILVVDASQGVEAQTISNLYLALEHNLTIIPVINKIDLQGAQIDLVKRQITEVLGIDESEIILASAKQGVGIPEIMQAVIERVPPPAGKADDPLRALIFDSMFDSYRGAVAYIRVFDGTIQPGMKIRFFSTGKEFEVAEVGTMCLRKFPQPQLRPGEVGYCIAGVKEVKDTKVGDTITAVDHPAAEPLPGYREVKPMVFSGIFPTASEQYEVLRAALDKLKLNDSALVYEPESSVALGFGFRCGFLGLLHLEIVQERLEREYGLDILTTVPNVEYWVYKTNGTKVVVDNPALMPNAGEISRVEEPYIRAQIITPAEYIGNIMKLAQERRGVHKNTHYLDTSRVDLTYEFPLAEIIFDFYDKLKSCTRGYASLDYEFIGYREGNLAKLDILINGDPVDALSHIVHRERAYEWGKKICEKLRELIPRQMFEVAIQAAIGSKIIARETVKAMRKNVTAKCYGGDITRKRKLLERQKEGKKRMKQLGQVEIPQEAFLAVLKVEH